MFKNYEENLRIQLMLSWLYFLLKQMGFFQSQFLDIF